MKKLISLAAASFFLVSCNSSDAQIEAWVKKNPDKILQAIMDHQKAEQEKNAPKAEMVQENAAELFADSSPSVGSGPIKIAYFFDFNCGHCVKQSETFKSLLAKTDKVQVFYKNFAVLGPSSEYAAKAALAAHQQKKYSEFYSELLKLKDKNPDTIKGIAKKLKLDIKKWEADLEGPAVNGEIEKTRSLANKMRIRGTPFVAIAPNMVFPGRVDQLAEIVQGIAAQ
jgi:protein-disulfide isomerase